MGVSNVVPGIVLTAYFVTIVAALVYGFTCLSRITASLQSIAATLSRIEARVAPPTPDDLSGGMRG